MKKFFKITGYTLLFLMGTFVAIGIVSGIMSGNNLARELKKDESPSVQKLSAQQSTDSFIVTPILREDMLEEALQSVVGLSCADVSEGEDAVSYMGSGVIVSEDGYIITNHHVICARPERIAVTLYNGEVIEGKTLWSDRVLDLAVVKIKGNEYIHSKLGDTKKLRVGESVVAIGNPLSMQFQRTVTAGIVSAVGRNISIENEDGSMGYMEDLIQTDASINPGNSGGPLLNEKGEVVAINTIKVTSAEGMGFAVPVNVCVPVLQRLRSVGGFRTPYLGLYAYTPAAARYFQKNKNLTKGLFVAKLDTEGPAFDAGIRYGDVIISVDGIETDTMLTLREQLYKKQRGDSVKIEYIRGGVYKSADVALTSVP